MSLPTVMGQTSPADTGYATEAEKNEAYVAALLHEQADYDARANTVRSEAVAAELARVGYEGDA